MLWRGRRESGNVDDRRGFSGRGLVYGGGIVGAVIYLLNLFLGGGNITEVSQQFPGGRNSEMTAREKAADEERSHFVKVVLAETEDVWNKIFTDQGREYKDPTLVLFRDYVQSACGNASAATGPFLPAPTCGASGCSPLNRIDGCLVGGATDRITSGSRRRPQPGVAPT